MATLTHEPFYTELPPDMTGKVEYVTALREQRDAIRRVQSANTLVQLLEDEGQSQGEIDHTVAEIIANAPPQDAVEVAVLGAVEIDEVGRDAVATVAAENALPHEALSEGLHAAEQGGVDIEKVTGALGNDGEPLLLHDPKLLEALPKHLTKGEAAHQLHDIFSPLASRVAETVIAGGDEVLIEKIQAIPRYAIPNKSSRYNIAHDTFMGMDHIEIPEHPPAPTGIGSALYVDEFYRPFVREVTDNYRQQHSDASPEDVDQIRRGVEYTFFHTAEKDFDEADWKAYEQSVGSMSDDERAEFAEHNTRRNLNIDKWGAHHPDMRQTDAVLYAHDTDVNHTGVFNHPDLPIGEYGEKFAAELQTVSILMNRHTEAALDPVVADIIKGHEELLGEYTARGFDQGVANTQSTKDTVHEGILSIMQVVAVLTVEKVDGYDDPHELVKDLVENGLVEKFARYSPLGMSGPMALGGYYIPGAIKRTNEGLAFSDEMSNCLKQARNRYIAEIAIQGPVHGRRQAAMGTMCPVAGKGDGIRKLSEAFSTALDRTAERSSEAVD